MAVRQLLNDFLMLSGHTGTCMTFSMLSGIVHLNLYRGGAFNVAVRELLNYYVAMEEFVMEEDVHKAISIREHPPGGLTTSMVHIFCGFALSSSRLLPEDTPV